MALKLIDDVWRDLDRLARTGARTKDLIFDPGAWAVATYRFSRAVRALPAPVRVPLAALYRPWELFIRTITGVRLAPDAEIGGGLFLAHLGGIVVAPGAHLGRDCNLSRGAVIGGGDRDAPWIGDRVYLGPGARILGPVRIGNDTAIGAHALVTADVPDGAAIGSAAGKLIHLIHGRRRPPMADQLRGFLRAVMPKPTQLLLRTA